VYTFYTIWTGKAACRSTVFSGNFFAFDGICGDNGYKWKFIEKEKSEFNGKVFARLPLAKVISSLLWVVTHVRKKN